MRRVAFLLSCCLFSFVMPVAAAPGPLSEIIVDVVEDAQPVRDVLRRLEDKHGLNYVVSEEVLARAGTVTVRLRKVPLDDALKAICSACDLNLQIQGSILVMLPKRSQPALPSVKEGLLPRGAKRGIPADPPPPIRKKPRRPSVLETPTPQLDDASAATVVGSVTEVDVKKGRLQLDVHGQRRDLFLPEGEDLRSTRLRLALSRMKPGFRVALRYTRHGSRSVILDLVGGDQVRAAEVPHRRRRVRRPRLDPAPLAKQPDAKPLPVKQGANVPEGVLTGKFVRRDGDKVLIRRVDGAIVTTVLPTDDELRTKVEALLSKLKDGSKVYMTVKEIDGKTVLQGGMSEVR